MIDFFNYGLKNAKQLEYQIFPMLFEIVTETPHLLSQIEDTVPFIYQLTKIPGIEQNMYTTYNCQAMILLNRSEWLNASSQHVAGLPYTLASWKALSTALNVFDVLSSALQIISTSFQVMPYLSIFQIVIPSLA